MNQELFTARQIRTAAYVVGTLAICSIAYAYGVATDESGFRGDTGGNDLAPINGFVSAVSAFLLCAVAFGGFETFLYYRHRRVAGRVIHGHDSAGL